MNISDIYSLGTAKDAFVKLFHTPKIQTVCVSVLLAMTKCLTEGIFGRKGLFGSQYNWIPPILVEKVMLARA